MKFHARIVFLTIMVFLYGATSLICSENNLQPLNRFKPKEVKKDFESMGISCEDAFQIDKERYVLTGGDDKGSNENDYGIRLFVIDGNNVVFRSKGMMDSYYLNPTFFRSDASNSKILILAEGGDEGGSYGIAVYELNHTHAKHIGYISASVLDNHEIISAVPFIEIVKNTVGYIFTFTRDVFVQDEKTYEYKTISKQSIKYIYDGKEEIKEIIE